ncbi:SDR family oxidoreductase [Azospirillum sp. TSO35-2]|uniref:SDR family oxidoreductase n=1 Tax=Azospirillum sp. TSO35-2 TaxID=716796 RepID=UPI000D61F448|nr:SDR family oxidoreductase [Azospirillum sp. TSO35-2]PWC37468.1 short-chain dehydrogenase [Azospirillum sp. TSO35-2]
MRKTVLITGCSSGIGRATALRFARQGWNVVATMRRPEPLPTPVEESGGDILVTRLDVQDRASIAEAVSVGLGRFGRIDALVNNAGFGHFGLFEAAPRETMLEQFDVNVFGVMDVTRALLPQFRANRAGVIVNVGSGAGLFTLPMLSLYCASKFALEGFSEALSYELASQGIAVKLVEPHGGVSATRFGERSAEEHRADAELADYDGFVARTRDAFGRMVSATTMDSDDVARVVFEAVTDGTDQLRYLVGDDARGFIKARRTLPEAEYVAFMRSWFRP